MGSSFNPQILVEKLAKLNNSQASIETLSHWCIFHMNKAKHVVETWDRQFHCAPREQRLAYLYLANDILQNSRRKGSEFVGEFWKVLPDALRDVIENGDEFGRNAALRLINIWEDRKVFGSRGQILKEEFLGRQPENGNRNGRHISVKLRLESGTLDKVVSALESIYGGQMDEDILIGKCGKATSCLEKVGKEVEADLSSGHSPGPATIKEVQGQHAVLRDCIEQLRAAETSRTDLISHLREALHEQEIKLEQVRGQLQVAQSQSDRTGDLCRRLLDHGGSQLAAGDSKEVKTSTASQSFVHSEVEQSAPVMYAKQASFNDKPSQAEEDPRKSAAAAVAAKLTASTSSAQMLSYVLSSLASEGIIGNPPVKESPPEKRPKIENHDQSYILAQHPQPTTVPSSSLPHSVAATSKDSIPPPPPPMPPVSPFQLPPQFLQPLQPPGPVNHVPFSYAMPMTTHQQQTSVPGYSPAAAVSTFAVTSPPANPYQKFQGSEGLYNTTSSMPMTPVSRQ